MTTRASDELASRAAYAPEIASASPATTDSLDRAEDAHDRESSADPNASRWVKRMLGSQWVIAALAWAGAWLMRLWGATWRVHIEGPDRVGPSQPTRVAAFWHRDMLVAAWYYRDRGFTVPVSRSRDGDLITALLARLGYSPSPRGSSSRGGASALRALIRRVRAGTSVAIQPDGPRGPARHAKPGVLALARWTRLPVLPIAFAARPCVHFRSWDETLLPLPFARVVCCYGDDVPAPDTFAPDATEHARQQLDAALESARDRAETSAGPGATRR